MTKYGALTEQVNNTVYERADTGYTITITKTCDWADAATYTPAIGTVHPDSDAYTLKRAAIDRIPGDLAKITLTYIAVNDSLPAKVAVEQTSSVEVPIQEHPNFSDWAADWDDDNQRFRATSTKAGITSYIKGSTVVTVTEYFESKPSSPKDDLGKLDSPGGDWGSATHWLVIGATRQKVGNYWAIEKTYEYSAKAYDSDIYDTA